jgi:hypothetical protein
MKSLCPSRFERGGSRVRSNLRLASAKRDANLGTGLLASTNSCEEYMDYPEHRY